VGLFRDLIGAVSMKDPVRGTAQVVSCSANRGDGVWQNCGMQLVVQADGVPATAVEHRELVHRNRWPMPGMTLPATVDRANPQTVKIEWDEVVSSQDRSRQTAEGLAAAMRGEGGVGATPGGVGGGFNVVNVSGGDLSQLSESQKAKLRMLGVDLEGLAPEDPGEEADERLARLERLGKLHEQGVLTDAEFEDQKRKILGG
jgi:hypothetical protein